MTEGLTRYLLNTGLEKIHIKSLKKQLTKQNLIKLIIDIQRFDLLMKSMSRKIGQPILEYLIKQKSQFKGYIKRQKAINGPFEGYEERSLTESFKEDFANG